MDVSRVGNQVSVETLRDGRGRRRRRATTGYAEPHRDHVITDPRLIAAATRANGVFKRIFDFTAAACGLTVLAPVLLTVALIVYIGDRGPAFFGHTRVGRHGRTFKCWKLRSMVRNGDDLLKAHLAANPEAQREWSETQKLTDDPRITPIGAFIRKTSIDELPQLWNVLVGEMSLIGPRPITRGELDRYGKARRYYLLVRPGITGLWQVSGRNSTTYDRRVELDRNYLENWSYGQDAMILLRTLPAVLKSEGAF